MLVQIFEQRLLALFDTSKLLPAFLVLYDIFSLAQNLQHVLNLFAEHISFLRELFFESLADLSAVDLGVLLEAHGDEDFLFHLDRLGFLRVEEFH